MFSRFTNWPMTALLRRELLRNLRTARPFLALLATALFCSLIVLAFWPSDNTPMQQVGMASATIIRGLALLLLAAVALFVPAFGATSIVLEHQERTYDQLRLTLISTWGVLLGKYFSAVGFFIILLICCAPILATLFFLTGLDWLTLAGSLLILLVTALSCGAVSVFSSVTIRRLPLAVMRAYLLTLCVLGLPSYVIFILAVVFGWQPSSAWAISLMTITSPFVSLVTLRMGLMNSGPLLLAALYHVVLAGVVLTLAWAILRRPRNPELPEDPNARPRGFAGWSRRIAKGVVPKHGPIPDWANPVYAREIRHAPSARRAYRRRAFLFSLIACASLAATLWGIERQRGGGYGDDLLVMYVGALMAIAGLASPGVVANALAKEREQDTLDLLRLTPMSPMRVVFGKTLAGLATMRAVLAGAIIASLVLAPVILGVREGMLFVATGFVSAAVYGFVGISLGILASACAKRSLTAMVLAYFFMAWVSFLMYVTVMLGGELLAEISDIRVAGPGRDVEQFFRWLSPMMAFFRGARLAGGHAYSVSAYWVSNVVVSMLSSVLAILLAGRVFASRMRREAAGARRFRLPFLRRRRP